MVQDLIKGNEVNEDSLNKQKSSIKDYMFNVLKLNKTENRRYIDDNVIVGEGYKIEGKRIIYNYERKMLFSNIPYHLGNIIRNNAYLKLYNLLKDKYDVSLVVSRITDATNAKVKNSFKIIYSKCTFYYSIDYIEITKDKNYENIDKIKLDGYGYDEYIKNINDYL